MSNLELIDDYAKEAMAAIADGYDGIAGAYAREAARYAFDGQPALRATCSTCDMPEGQCADWCTAEMRTPVLDAMEAALERGDEPAAIEMLKGLTWTEVTA
jgi:hypothetical protein